MAWFTPAEGTSPPPGTPAPVSARGPFLSPTQLSPQPVAQRTRQVLRLLQASPPHQDGCTGNHTGTAPTRGDRGTGGFGNVHRIPPQTWPDVLRGERPCQQGPSGATLLPGPALLAGRPGQRASCPREVGDPCPGRFPGEPKPLARWQWEGGSSKRSQSLSLGKLRL